MLKSLRIITAAGAVAAAAAVAAGCGNSTSANTHTPRVAAAQAPAAQGPIKATVSEWAVNVTPASAPAGKVTFDVTNTGKAPHEFVVLRTDKPAAGLAAGSGARVPETGHVGEIGGLAAGATKSVTLNLPAGHYALVCNLPGHYKLGMHADFTVS